MKVRWCGAACARGFVSKAAVELAAELIQWFYLKGTVAGQGSHVVVLVCTNTYPIGTNTYPIGTNTYPICAYPIFMVTKHAEQRDHVYLTTIVDTI